MITCDRDQATLALDPGTGRDFPGSTDDELPDLVDNFEYLDDQQLFIGLTILSHADTSLEGG